MPVFGVQRSGKAKREVDPCGLYLATRDLVSRAHQGPPAAFLEASGAMPGQGVAGVFSLGRSFGIVLGVLATLEIPYTIVSPARWKRAVGIPAKAGKDASRLRASQLMPGAAEHWRLVKHHGRAEAALIAWYGAHLNSGEKHE